MYVISPEIVAEDGLKAQKLLAQGVWMQNTLFFQGVLDVTYDTPSSFICDIVISIYLKE